MTQTLQVRAENLISARKGERVYIESAGSTVLWAAALVYLIPLVGFFLGYFLGSLWDAVGLASLVENQVQVLRGDLGGSDDIRGIKTPTEITL